MNSILEKNIQALASGVNQPLANKLIEFIQKQNFNRFDIDENLNIFDHYHGILMYENVQEEINYFQNTIVQQSLRYPFICIYGIGNGLLIKNLSQNYRHIFVFESKIELFALALNTIDLSQELKSGTIYLVDTTETKMSFQLSMLFDQYGTFEWLSLYKMFINCTYYKKYYKNYILEIDNKCQEIIHIVIRNFNPGDVLTTLCYKQFLQNLSEVLNSIPLQRLLNERKNKFENAIVVSAGPSLSKQLPLLKKYQDKALIFCADGALNTLLQENIKPDYILNLDFENLPCKFFSDLRGCKDSVFLLAATTHPNVIELLKNQNKVLVISNISYYKYYHLEEFGYIDIGTHVSHFSYTMALALGCKNIIMIGQDLAFDKEGNSHTKDFALGKDTDAKLNFPTLRVPAYAGKGEVLTHIVWNDYRVKLEYLFARNTQVKFYNATEGGAKINFTEELSFKECCEKLLKKNKPEFDIPKTLTLNRSKKLFTKFKDTIQKNIQICQNFIDDANALEQALYTIINSNKELPLSFLCNVYKNISNFDTHLRQNKLMGDNFLKALHGYKGKCISETIALKIQDESQFLFSFLQAYHQFLKVLIPKIKNRQELFLEIL
ncbi:motility associated factor glycosyltransferase family protein [Campylobacter coli]|uniref:motility associated factor glycosyltransferase family protein n=1 Tax=Campylobacter coli TaxID=195 RepID=UPI00156DE3A8|nr:motility associated factor glycosyltransferase family protein [Campylobacter coli]BEK36667.1 motility associated factor glycosyltransferase family protein [Campylobacter coli]HDV6425779.1 motility associated factor glycosyltransferase family protein [Campylobacter coli]